MSACPQALRGVERNGKTPDQQLVDGLKVIGGQIDEMAGQLAQGDLDALSTRGRYLEIKYQGDQGGGLTWHVIVILSCKRQV